MDKNKTEDILNGNSDEEHDLELVDATNDSTVNKDAADKVSFEARHIWEQLLEQFNAIRFKLEEIDTRLEKIEEGMETVNNKASVLNDTILNVRAAHKSLKRQVTQIESDLVH